MYTPQMSMMSSKIPADEPTMTIVLSALSSLCKVTGLHSKVSSFRTLARSVGEAGAAPRELMDLVTSAPVNNHLAYLSAADSPLHFVAVLTPAVTKHAGDSGAHCIFEGLHVNNESAKYCRKSKESKYIHTGIRCG
jgi:hypothetical protein